MIRRTKKLPVQRPNSNLASKLRHTWEDAGRSMSDGIEIIGFSAHDRGYRLELRVDGLSREEIRKLQRIMGDSTEIGIPHPRTGYTPVSYFFESQRLYVEGEISELIAKGETAPVNIDSPTPEGRLIIYTSEHNLQEVITQYVTDLKEGIESARE